MGMSAGDGSTPEINVTPLIDVCLVLLVIFMIVTPMLQKGAAVDLPKTQEPEKKPDSPNQRILAVDQAGNYFVDRDRYPGLEQVKRYLIEERERIPGLEVHLKGDRRLEYGKVLDLMRTLHDAEINNVSLVTERIQEGVL